MMSICIKEYNINTAIVFAIANNLATGIVVPPA